MDIGILFDHYEDLAESFRVQLEKEGFFVEMNEPYSGKFGLMYSADRHCRKHKILHLELEFNQSILCSQKRIQFVADKMVQALSKLDLENCQLQI